MPFFRFFIILILCSIVSSLSAQKEEVFKGTFINTENKVKLYLDLEGKSLIVPGYDFLGATPGYMCGDIYGIWLLTYSKIKNQELELRFSNDQGSDNQTILFKQISDSTFLYQTIGGNSVKRVVNRKLVKIPSSMVFSKQE